MLFHILCLLLLGSISSASFYEDDEYLQVEPYKREQIERLKKILHIKNDDPEPDEYLSTTDLIKKYGYPVEEHFVTTEDGYILKMHRIPPTKPGVVPNNKTILLMHGMISSSADFIVLGPKKALGYYLADHGFDVWMGNKRGNMESRNHTKLSPKRRAFWQYSFHEIGFYDLPAMIDHILETTGQKAIYYAGYSEGTTVFFVMASERPEYNHKIIASFSMAAITHMKHTYSPFMRVGSKFTHIQRVFTKLFGVNELLPHSSLITMVGDTFCRDGELSEILCRNIIFLVAGFDRSHFNDTILPTMFGHMPAGCSAMEYLHFLQLVASGKFLKFDYYGSNFLHYGPRHIFHPPSYNLRKVTAPVHLFYTKHDWIASEQDVAQLCQDVVNCKSQILVDGGSFNHLDYIMADGVTESVYKVIVDKIYQQ